MTITAIILAHFTQREKQLPGIIDGLLGGTVKPDQIIVFIDNPAVNFSDGRVVTIRSNASIKPNIRFALGSVAETDCCFFIDDDLNVKQRTLENFVNYADKCEEGSILGYQGSILGKTDTPYVDDRPIRRYAYGEPIEVDIIVRTYFAPTKSLMAGLRLRALHPELPRDSVDDIFLSLGNKYLNGKKNFVIPIDSESDLIDLDEGGVGQSYNGNHYGNRNVLCKALRDIYE